MTRMRSDTVRLLAGRGAGEVLIQAKEIGELSKGAATPTRLQGGTALKLGDLGITKNQSSNWQAMASVDEDKFQEVVEYGTPWAGYPEYPAQN